MLYIVRCILVALVAGFVLIRSSEPLNDSVRTEDLLNSSIQSDDFEILAQDHQISPFKKQILATTELKGMQRDGVSFIDNQLVCKASKNQKDLALRVHNANVIKKIITDYNLSLIDVSEPQVSGNGRIDHVFERYQGQTLDNCSQGLTVKHIEQLMQLVVLTGWRDVRPRNLVLRDKDKKLCIIDTDKVGFLKKISLPKSLEQMIKCLDQAERIYASNDSDSDSSQSQRPSRLKRKINYSEVDDQLSDQDEIHNVSSSKRRKIDSPSSSQESVSSYYAVDHSPSSYLRENLSNILERFDNHQAQRNQRSGRLQNLDSIKIMKEKNMNSGTKRKLVFDF